MKKEIIVSRPAMLGVRTESKQMRLSMLVKVTYDGCDMRTTLPWGPNAKIDVTDLLNLDGSPFSQSALLESYYKVCDKAQIAQAKAKRPLQRIRKRSRAANSSTIPGPSAGERRRLNRTQHEACKKTAG